jgi:hypothetical protein
MSDDPISNENGNNEPELPGVLTALELVKAKLGITTNSRDVYLDVLVRSVYEELAEIQGIRLTDAQKERLDVVDLVADVAVFKFQNHGGPLPPNLRLRLNNLYVKYAGWTHDAGL